MRTDPLELPHHLMATVRGMLAEEATRHLVREAIRELVDVNSVSGPDLAQTAAREQAVLEAIEDRAIGALGSDCTVRRVPILPEIDRLQEYTLPAYARRADGSLPLAGEVYAGRYNLLVTMPGADAQGEGLAFNAHVDVVAPYLPFQEDRGRLWGRGTVDDKGQCVAMLAAATVLGRLRAETGTVPPGDVSFQFVIDEEIGGNGSLSLAADRGLGCGCVCVCEATDLNVHPANRGATWYRIEIETAPEGGPSAALVGAHVLLELRAEGDRIRAESEHPLFPDRPVQTCNGMVGGWGQHPSRVCPVMGLCVVRAKGAREADWKHALEGIDAACRRGVQRYCERHGDATRQPDPDDPTRAKVLRHCDTAPHEGYIFIALYGKAGHMGKIDVLDCAATKAAYVMAELEGAVADGSGIALAEAPPHERQLPPAEVAGAPLVLGPDRDSLHRLVMEGGQGFVPTHSIREVQERIASAASRAARSYCKARGLGADTVRVRTAFERLHNNAFERPADSEGMRAALAAARLAGVYGGEPLRGFEVSCDARLFADLRPEMDVVTFGPGQLRYAHSDEESITVEEILKGAEVLVYMALLYGRSRPHAAQAGRAHQSDSRAD